VSGVRTLYIQLSLISGFIFRNTITEVESFQHNDTVLLFVVTYYINKQDGFNSFAFRKWIKELKYYSS